MNYLVWKKADNNNNLGLLVFLFLRKKISKTEYS